MLLHKNYFETNIQKFCVPSLKNPILSVTSYSEIRNKKRKLNKIKDLKKKLKFSYLLSYNKPYRQFKSYLSGKIFLKRCSRLTRD